MSVYSWQIPMYDKSNLTIYFNDMGYEVLFKQTYKTRRTYVIAKKLGRSWAKIGDEEYSSMQNRIMEDYPGASVIRMDGFLLPDHKKKQTLKVQIPLERAPELTEQEMRTYLIEKGFDEFYLIGTQRKGSFHFAPVSDFNEEEELRLKEIMREIGYKAIIDAHQSMRRRMFNRPRNKSYKLIRQITG